MVILVPHEDIVRTLCAQDCLYGVSPCADYKRDLIDSSMEIAATLVLNLYEGF